jgi:signal transduction histidine kinase
MIWTGLAKETAHQFGTPISSLIGWIDFLRIKIENNPQKEELNSIFNDMNHDVEILKKVASRFGKVGSNIALIPSDIDEIIMDTIEYYKKRLPNDNNKIKMIYKTLNPKTILNIDKELFSWAIENIIRNCIDAMKNKKGVIKIQSYRQEESFFILIKDQGEGIKKSMLKSIFEPGVTTKERGWGLGLSLTKRIIEEYHNGKVKVLDSSAKQGTTIEITLPYNFEIIKKGI